MEFTKRRILISTIVILALATIIAVILYNRTAVRRTNTADQNNTTIKKEDLVLNDVPGGLPDNLPTEPGAQILQNYEASSKGEMVQGTRKFTTNKSFAESMVIYKNFFSSKDWKTVDEQETDTLRSTLMRRNESTLLIVTSKDTVSSKNTVELTLSEPVKK